MKKSILLVVFYTIPALIISQSKSDGIFNIKGGEIIRYTNKVLVDERTTLYDHDSIIAILPSSFIDYDETDWIEESDESLNKFQDTSRLSKTKVTITKSSTPLQNSGTIYLKTGDKIVYTKKIASGTKIILYKGDSIFAIFPIVPSEKDSSAVKLADTIRKSESNAIAIPIPKGLNNSLPENKITLNSTDSAKRVITKDAFPGSKDTSKAVSIPKAILTPLDTSKLIAPSKDIKIPEDTVKPKPPKIVLPSLKDTINLKTPSVSIPVSVDSSKLATPPKANKIAIDTAKLSHRTNALSPQKDTPKLESQYKAILAPIDTTKLVSSTKSISVQKDTSNLLSAKKAIPVLKDTTKLSSQAISTSALEDTSKLVSPSNLIPVLKDTSLAKKMKSVSADSLKRALAAKQFQQTPLKNNLCTIDIALSLGNLLEFNNPSGSPNKNSFSFSGTLDFTHKYTKPSSIYTCSNEVHYAIGIQKKDVAQQSNSLQRSQDKLNTLHDHSLALSAKRRWHLNIIAKTDLPLFTVFNGEYFSDINKKGKLTALASPYTLTLSPGFKYTDSKNELRISLSPYSTEIFGVMNSEVNDKGVYIKEKDDLGNFKTLIFKNQGVEMNFWYDKRVKRWLVLSYRLDIRSIYEGGIFQNGTYNGFFITKFIPIKNISITHRLILRNKLTNDPLSPFINQNILLGYTLNLY